MVLPLAVQAVVLLTRAHAHNDYEHPRPLIDALQYGFCSVEADVYLAGDELQVGHDRKDLRPGRTLELLYLDPLFSRWKKYRGSIYAKKAEFTLLVDVKVSGELVWARMKKVLEIYRPMLTSYTSGKVKKGAVTLILSGDRPIEALRNEKERLAFIDGRLPDLESKPPTSLVPLVSASFEDTFKDGVELNRLRGLVSRSHEQGRRIRFWAAPDDDKGWATLYNAGVDLINTDRLAELSVFLRAKGGKLDPPHGFDDSRRFLTSQWEPEDDWLVGPIRRGNGRGARHPAVQQTRADADWALTEGVPEVGAVGEDSLRLGLYWCPQ